MYYNAFSGLELVTGKKTKENEALLNEMNRQLQQGHVAGQEGYHDNENGAELPEWVRFGLPGGFESPPPGVVPHRLDNGVICYFDAAELEAALQSGVQPEELILSRN